MKRRTAVSAMAGLWMCTLPGAPALWAQQQQPTLSKDDQYKISEMLRDAHDDVKKHYYDPKLQGLDWDAQYKRFSAMIPKAQDIGTGFEIVAAFLDELKDSHTYFVPPMRSTRYDYGFRFELIGNECFVTHVRPATDAESRLRVGDQIMRVDGYNLNRDDFHKLGYFLNVLSPQVAEQLDLRSPTGEVRRVVVRSSVRPLKKIMDLTGESDGFDLVRRSEDEDHATRSRLVESGDLAIWKLRQFDLDDGEVDKFMGQARKHKTLILDLRGNPGGAEDTLKYMVGAFFDHDIKISDRVTRKKSEPLIARQHGTPFNGKLIVLVDAGSASAAEIFARVMQLEHRGTVIGDRTAGAVMEAEHYRESRGVDVKFFYAFSVTEADLIMTDGKSLEKTGVTPDEQVLPTGADLAAGRDPMLVRAAELGGVKLDPVEAGKMFPFEWLPL
ncbi:MAG: hypothetical protein KGM96_10580 [Acidobacteriota bacterium]|nr:hypothetical protein [Acidobacteriota bacterium]